MPIHGAFTSLCTDLLRTGRPVRFRASGSSMAPALRDGDLVTVVPVRAEDVRAGDVLLYASARGLTAHRVLKRLPDGAGFRLRGDAPGSEEEQVDPDQVLGRVEAAPGPLLPRWVRRVVLAIRARLAP